MKIFFTTFFDDFTDWSSEDWLLLLFADLIIWEGDERERLNKACLFALDELSSKNPPGENFLICII